MNKLIFLTNFIFEILTAVFYFTDKFTSVKAYKYIILSFIAVGIIQYSASFFENSYLNLLIFFLSYLFIGKYIYGLSMSKAIFHSVLLAGLMMSTEFAATYILNLFLDINIANLFYENQFNLLVLSSTAKLLYFVSTYIVSKISIKEPKETISVHQTVILLIFPIASIFVLMVLDKTTKTFKLNSSLLICYFISAILLLYSNILIFAVHEYTLRIYKQNIELMLQTQKHDIDMEYYYSLQKQQEIADIIMHDIKKHMIAVRDIAADEHNTEIVKYIDSVYEISDFNKLKHYSSNKLIDVIVNRFAQKFMEHFIDFYSDIRDIDFSFLNDSELTALLDNLLSNAFNSSVTAQNKIVELEIKIQNQHFIVISVTNTCGEKPIKKNNKYVSKNKNGLHGIGLKSVENIVKKHNGRLSLVFNEENMQFKANVVIRNF